jgi:hypothetical protein
MLAAAIMVLGLLTGCHTGAKAPVAAPLTLAQLRPILLTSAQLPTGFVPSPDGSGAFGLCDRVWDDIGRAPTQIEDVFGPPDNQGRLYELLVAFANVAPSRQIYADFLGYQARGSGSCQLTTTHLPALLPVSHEEFASYQIALPGHVVYDVGMIRSGAIVTVLMLGVRWPGPVPAATWQSVVHAAGVNVASATGT